MLPQSRWFYKKKPFHHDEREFIDLRHEKSGLGENGVVNVYGHTLQRNESDGVCSCVCVCSKTAKEAHKVLTTMTIFEVI